MKEKAVSRQQQGLSTLILILLLAWGLSYFVRLQGDLGPVARGGDIFVLITGAVRNPGVYAFEGEVSLGELVSRAGGLEMRPTDYKGDTGLQLASGTRVNISWENGYVKVSTGAMPAPYKVTLRIPISINTASQQELVAIPDIGPALAKRIVTYRSLHGPFRTKEDIMGVAGIGELRYSRIRPYIGT